MHNGKKPPMMDKKGMSNVKAKDFKGTLKKLINYIKEYFGIRYESTLNRYYAQIKLLKKNSYVM